MSAWSAEKKIASVTGRRIFPGNRTRFIIIIGSVYMAVLIIILI
jgi:hypothetical protein